MSLTIGSLFSGIGGIELGLERAGLGPVLWQAETDPFCRSVLQRRWPHATRFHDVRAVDQHAARPDILCGGFPCQDVSSAGKRRGLEGEHSGLWTEFARCICELRPRFVLVENVADLLVRGFGRVLGDLAAIGYDAEWDCIPAAAAGSPQLRARVWILAYPHGKREQEGIAAPVFAGRTELVRSVGWAPEPAICRVAHGLPRGVVARELHALGNAVVPQCVELIGHALREATCNP